MWSVMLDHAQKIATNGTVYHQNESTNMVWK